jgi:hypothetical protein
MSTKSASYRKLGMAVLAAHVRALRRPNCALTLPETVPPSFTIRARAVASIGCPKAQSPVMKNHDSLLAV